MIISYIDRMKNLIWTQKQKATHLHIHAERKHILRLPYTLTRTDLCILWIKTEKHIYKPNHKQRHKNCDKDLLNHRYVLNKLYT